MLPLPDGAKTIDTPKLCGVYFLIKNDEILYIGKSRSLFSRIMVHYTDKKYDYDSFSYIEVDEAELSKIERHYILKYRPRNNRQYLIVCANPAKNKAQEKLYEKWAKRRKVIRGLREQDPKVWTYRKLAGKYRISTERVRQLLNGKKPND